MLTQLRCGLRFLQSMEPTGVGARDLAECLTLQLRTLPRGEAQAIAIIVCKSHLPLLARRDLKKLMAVTGADENLLREAQALIVSLEPKPGPAVLARRGEHRRPRRHRAEVRPRLEGGAQPRRDAQAAHQRPLRQRDPPAARRRARQRAQRRRRRPQLAAAGGALVRQEHPAALRHHPARLAGDRRAAEELLHPRRDRDEAAGAARDRRRARPARVDDLARHHRQVHVDAVRHLRAQVLLRLVARTPRPAATPRAPRCAR